MSVVYLTSQAHGFTVRAYGIGDFDRVLQHVKL